MKHIFWLLLLLFASSSAWAQTSSLRGKVTDQNGAAVVGVKVTVSGPSGLTKSTKTDNNGSYSFTGLPLGDCEVQASAPNLELAEPVKVNLKAGPQTLNLQLKVVLAPEKVTVEENAAPSVTTDPSNNASAQVLRGNDLDSLPDSPEDLQAALLALAGPSAGPSGGQIFIDGFSGGQLPSNLFQLCQPILEHAQSLRGAEGAIPFERVRRQCERCAQQTHFVLCRHPT